MCGEQWLDNPPSDCVDISPRKRTEPTVQPTQQRRRARRRARLQPNATLMMSDAGPYPESLLPLLLLSGELAYLPVFNCILIYM